MPTLLNVTSFTILPERLKSLPFWVTVMVRVKSPDFTITFPVRGSSEYSFFSTAIEISYFLPVVEFEPSVSVTVLVLLIVTSFFIQSSDVEKVGVSPFLIVVTTVAIIFSLSHAPLTWSLTPRW